MTLLPSDTEGRDKRIRAEVDALNRVMRALLRLPEDARPRVLRYLVSRYGR